MSPSFWRFFSQGRPTIEPSGTLNEDCRRHPKALTWRTKKFTGPTVSYAWESSNLLENMAFVDLDGRE